MSDPMTDYLEALENYGEARDDYRKAYDAARDSASPAYWTQRQGDALRKATERLETSLRALIRAEVSAVMALEAGEGEE